MGSAENLSKKAGKKATTAYERIGKSFDRMMSENAKVLDEYENASQAVYAGIRKKKRAPA